MLFHFKGFFLVGLAEFSSFRCSLQSVASVEYIWPRGARRSRSFHGPVCPLGEILLIFVYLGYLWQKYSYKTLTWMSISFVLAGIVTGNLGGRIGIPAVSYIGVSVSFVVLGGIAILSTFFRVLRQVFIGESSKESSDS